MKPGRQKSSLPDYHWMTCWRRYCWNHKTELGVATIIIILFMVYTIDPVFNLSDETNTKTPPREILKRKPSTQTKSPLTGSKKIYLTNNLSDETNTKTPPRLIQKHKPSAQTKSPLTGSKKIYLTNTQKSSDSKQVRFNKDSPIACMNFKGRLGNIIIEYAFLYIISKMKGLYPVIPENFQLLDVFEINKTTLKTVGKSPNECGKAKLYRERWPCSFDEKMMEVPPGQSARFDGFFQSWKYWTNYEKELRKVFTFKPKIREKTSKQFSDILKKLNYRNSPDDVIVSIHARRGDYLSKQDRDIGKLTPNASYYLNAMDYYRKRYKRVYFMMASDGIDWAKKHLGSQPNIHFSEGNSPAEDIALMSKANHTIMSVGSFGWLIGWLAGGTTVHYERFFVPGSSYSRDFKNSNMSEFIPPGWVSMV